MKRKLKEKRLDARNMNWPPAPTKKSRKEKKEDWLSNIVVRPSKGEER
jgi:hypothetical protein